MSKRALSVTLDENNVLWLRGRASAGGSRSISDALDRLVTEARTSGRLADATMRSVVGTIDIASDDPSLQSADLAVRKEFDRSLRRPLISRKAATRRKRRGA